MDPSAQELLVPPIILQLADACRAVRAHCPFGGREATFQAMLETEARLRGLTTQREVIRGMRYKGIPLGNNTSIREDLVVSSQLDTIVVELKVAKRLEHRDFQQICRYLLDRGRGSHGLLVCFGDTCDEAWYVTVGTAPTGECRMQRARVLHDEFQQPEIWTHGTFDTNGSV